MILAVDLKFSFVVPNLPLDENYYTTSSSICTFVAKTSRLSKVLIHTSSTDSDDLRQFQNKLNMSATLVYVAASTNRFSNAADVSPSSFVIAFGSSRLLALWHTDVSLSPPNLIFGPLKFLSGSKRPWSFANTSRTRRIYNLC